MKMMIGSIRTTGDRVETKAIGGVNKGEECLLILI
jgi:hypothetical protein